MSVSVNVAHIYTYTRGLMFGKNGIGYLVVLKSIWGAKATVKIRKHISQFQPLTIKQAISQAKKADKQENLLSHGNPTMRSCCTNLAPRLQQRIYAIYSLITGYKLIDIWVPLARINLGTLSS